MRNRLQEIWAEPRRLKHFCLGLIAIAGIILLYPTRGSITLEWQLMYRPEEFTEWPQLWVFLTELQTAISPFWAFLEICAQLIFGSTWIFVKVGYILAAMIGFMQAMRLFGTDRIRILLIAGLSIVFIMAIRVLHKGNPSLYDLYVPILFLAFISSLQRARAGKREYRDALLAGFFLAVLELTRSFVFPMLPVLLLLAFFSLAKNSLHARLLFFLPVLLLSGGWHLKQLTMHGQLHWSNHSGFNLQKVWGDFMPEPVTYPEAAPRYAGGFPNLNTDVHTAENRELTGLVVKAVTKQPVRAVGRTVSRVIAFYAPRTDLYLAKMGTVPSIAYRPAVWFGGLCALVGFGILMFRLIRNIRRRQSWLELGDPENILILGIAMMSCLVALGEKGEEARFMISLLPLLACVPGWKLHLGTRFQ